MLAIDFFTRIHAPEWHRWVMIALGGYGVVASVLFVGGFLSAPARSYRRTDIETVDQWFLFAAAGLASALYFGRWAFRPPETWGGPWFSVLTISVLTLVDAAFTIRLWTWRKAVRRATNGG